MKTKIKYLLNQFHLYQNLDLMRRRTEVAQWHAKGYIGVAPPPIKRAILAAYMKRYNLKYFVETGTHLGDTIAFVANNPSINSTSVELDDTYFANAATRFSSYKNVKLLHGDSGKLMPDIVKGLNQPALFWLDGHYSGGDTGQGSQDTSISEELTSIFRSPISGHVILIDDVHCFNGTHNYPHLDEVLAAIRKNDNFDVEVSTDIIRLTPKALQAPL